VFSNTFPINNGYLVMRCMGLIRKEDKGMPLVRQFAWHFFTTSLKAVFDSVRSCKRAALSSWRPQNVMYAVILGN